MKKEIEYRKRLVDIKQSSDLYENPAVKRFLETEQERIGIIGGGISILSKANKKPILLYSPDVRQKFIDNEKFKYIHNSYEDSVPTYDKYIDLLFFISRNTSCPEFVTNICLKKQNKFEYPFQHYLRTKYEILHCSCGEILFFTLLWRLVIELIVHNNSGIQIKNLSKTPNLWGKKDTWNSRFEKGQIENDLIEHINKAGQLQSIDTSIYQSIYNAHQQFKNALLNQTSTISDIFKEFGLNKKKHIDEINKYIGLVLDSGIELKRNLSEKQLQSLSLAIITRFCQISRKSNTIKLGELLSTLHNTARFPILPYYFLMFFDEKKKLKEHIVFPVWYTFSNDTKYLYKQNENDLNEEETPESAVIHALYTVKPIWEMPFCKKSQWYTNDFKAKMSSQKFSDYLTQIYVFFSSFCKPIIDIEYYAKEFNKREKNIREQAQRASFSQVMVRNLSHNIGSHVFSNLIDNQVYDNLADKVNHPCINSTMPKTYLSDCIVATDDDMTNNRQLAYFNRYLKSRMDYLSEVTFGVSNTLTTKKLYADVFLELDRVRLLLNHISGIRDFKYKFILQYGNKELKENDISAAFPSDVLGCQAFYNIIENIIRNTAKYANGNASEEKNITIHFNDIIVETSFDNDFQQYYQVEIDDSIPLIGRKIRETSDKKLIKFIGSIKDKSIENDKFREKWEWTEQDDDGIPKSISSKEELSEIEWLVINQNYRFNNDVFDKDYKLRNHSLGLMEMEASAAFLRQIDFSEHGYEIRNDDKLYDSRSNNLLIIKAFATLNNALGYRFFIKKPQEFLFVGNWNLSEDKKKQLQNQGIWFKTDTDFVKAMNENNAFFHQFAIYQSDINDNAKQILDFTEKTDDNLKYQTLLPLRRILVKEELLQSINQIFQQKSNCTEILKQLKEKIWCGYFKDKIGIAMENIDIRGQVNTTSTKHQVIFLDHANKCTFDRDNNNQYRNNKEIWIENFSSNSRNKLPDFPKLSINANGEEPMVAYRDNIKSNQQIKCEIFEAYHNKVIVIDERVQRFAEKNTEGKESQIPSKALFNSTNVCMPEIPLDPVSFSTEQANNIEQYINDKIDNSFLLIHYGILERLYVDIIKRNEMLEKWAKEGKRVVVTSGRGQHSLDLPNSVCYINLSSMLYAFVENRNKYSINYLLNQSRRKNG